MKISSSLPATLHEYLAAINQLGCTFFYSHDYIAFFCQLQELISYPNASHLARNIMAEKEETIIILSDPPHLLKKFR